MSETEITGTTDTGSAETSGSTASTPPALKERAFAEMAKADDVGDYIAERNDREAESKGDDSVETPHRKQERLDRYRRALERARQEGEPSNEPAEVAEQPAEHTYAPTRDDEIRQARADAQFELRAKQYMEKQPDFEDTVRGAFSVIPPGPVLTDAVRESPLGPELAYLFAQNPDAIMELNALPPAQALRIVGAIEGRLAHERAQGAKAPASEGKRVSSAPPPIKGIGGSMSKPSNSIHDLAKKDDMTEYVAVRNRQEKAAR